MGDHFPMWFLLCIDAHIDIPYTIASFLSSSLASGTHLWSKIYGLHIISRLDHSYGVDTHGMTHYPLLELHEAALIRLWVVVHGPDRIVRISPDNVDAPIRQVDPEHREEREFQLSYR